MVHVQPRSEHCPPQTRRCSTTAHQESEIRPVPLLSTRVDTGTAPTVPEEAHQPSSCPVSTTASAWHLVPGGARAWWCPIHSVAVSHNALRRRSCRSLKGDAHAGLRVATSSATAAVVEPAAASAGDATSLGGAGGAHGQSWVTHPAAQVAFVMLCAALVTLMSKRPTKPGGVPPNSDTSAATAPLTPRRRPGRRYGSASPASPASPAPRTVRGGIASTGRLSSPRKRSPGAGFSRSPPTPSRHV